MGMRFESIEKLFRLVEHVEDDEDEDGESCDHADGVTLEDAALRGFEGVADDLGGEADEEDESVDDVLVDDGEEVG